MYRFIVLYVCIYVAPWSCEARHLVPLYVPTCSRMTIKLNLNLNLNMNFTKDLVLCEIIERHEGKSIIVVVNFFYCRIIIQTDSFDCHVVCMKECDTYNYIAYSDHLYWALFAFKFWLLTLKMMHVFFEGISSFLHCRFDSVCVF